MASIYGTQIINELNINVGIVWPHFDRRFRVSELCEILIPDRKIVVILVTNDYDGHQRSKFRPYA